MRWSCGPISFTGATLITTCHGTFQRALRHERYSDTQQWVLARFLQQTGMVPGTKVAVIGGPATHCTWAHVDRMRVVAELATDLYAGTEAGSHLFWHSSPETQKQTLAAFSAAGAQLVIAPIEAGTDLSGWTPVPGSDVVIRDLRQTPIELASGTFVKSKIALAGSQFSEVTDARKLSKNLGEQSNATTP